MTVMDYSYETFRQINPYLSFMMFAILMLSMLALYFLPSIIAMMRQHPQKWLLAGLNVFAGWTGLLWIGLLVWALWPREKLPDSPAFFVPFGDGWGTCQDHERNRFPGQQAAPFRLEESLEQLASMRERGLLTEEEFAKAKEKLINRL